MSKRILKWELRIAATTTLEVPAGTDLLAIGFQGERLFIWTAQPVGLRASRRWTIRTVETDEYTPQGEHVGTALGTWRGSPYVAHAYMTTEVLP